MTDQPEVTPLSAVVCGMCGAPAVCLSVDNEPPARAMFACGDCCGCGNCASVHDAENPYCAAETGGCWRLFAIPDYVNQLRDDLNALDETTASEIDQLRAKVAELEARALDTEMISAIAGAIFEQPFVVIPRDWRRGDDRTAPDVKCRREIVRVICDLIIKREEIARRKGAK